MSTYHAVVWIDSSEAHVLMFDREHVEAERIKSRSTHTHKAQGGHVGSRQGAHGGRGPAVVGHHSPDAGQAESDPDYFSAVVQALGGVHEILLTGPAQAKDHFRDYCRQKAKAVDQAIVDVVPSDHPSDAQLVALARKYFLKHDKMQSQTGRP